MPRYRCSVCGAECTSKNVYTRTVFIDWEEQFVGPLLATLLVTTKEYRPGSKFECIQLEYGCLEPKDLQENLPNNLWSTFQLLARVPERVWEIHLCRHEWQIIPGTGEPL